MLCIPIDKAHDKIWIFLALGVGANCPGVCSLRLKRSWTSGLGRGWFWGIGWGAMTDLNYTQEKENNTPIERITPKEIERESVAAFEI